MRPAPAEGRWEAATPVLPRCLHCRRGPLHPPCPQAGLGSATGRARAARHSPAAPARGRRHRSPPVPTAAQAPRRDGGQMGKRPPLRSLRAILPPREKSPGPAEERGGRTACVPGRRRAAGRERGGRRRGRERPAPLSRSPASPARRCPPPRGAERQRRPRAPRPAPPLPRGGGDGLRGARPAGPSFPPLLPGEAAGCGLPLAPPPLPFQFYFVLF